LQPPIRPRAPIERASGRIKKHHARAVVDDCKAVVQSIAKAIASEDVESLVEHERWRVAQLAEQSQKLGAHAHRARGMTRYRKRAAQSVEMLPRVVLEHQRGSQRIENLSRRVHFAALFEPRIVIDADAGSHGDLFATQTRHATMTVDRDAGHSRIDVRSTAGEELGHRRRVAGKFIAHRWTSIRTSGRPSWSSDT